MGVWGAEEGWRGVLAIMLALNCREAGESDGVRGWTPGIPAPAADDVETKGLCFMGEPDRD